MCVVSAASSSWTERSSHQVLLRVTSVDAKQVDSQLFLSKSGFNLALAQNCSLGSATMQSHVQVPIQGGKETTFIKGQRKLRARGNSESMAFHWLSPFQEGRGLPSSCWLWYHHSQWELPLLDSEASVYSFFTPGTEDRVATYWCHSPSQNSLESPQGKTSPSAWHSVHNTAFYNLSGVISLPHVYLSILTAYFLTHWPPVPSLFHL